MISSNIYLENIQSLFSDGKYKTWYSFLISKALKRVDYTKASHKKQAQKYVQHVERHHICPKSIFPDFAKHKENLAYLSSREHFLAHLLLYKMAKKDCNHIVEMGFALSKMRQTNKNVPRILNSIQYKMARNAAIDANKNRQYPIGHKQSKETIAKRVETYHKHYPGHSDDTKKLLSISASGRKASTETRTKMSNSRKGKSTWNKGKPTKLLYTEQQRKEKFGNPGNTHPLYGTTRAQTTRNKISAKRKGKYCGSANGMYGAKHTEDSILLMTINKIKPNIKNISYELTVNTWEQFVNEVYKYSLTHSTLEVCEFYGLSRYVFKKISHTYTED